MKKQKTARGLATWRVGLTLLRLSADVVAHESGYISPALLERHRAARRVHDERARVNGGNIGRGLFATARCDFRF